MTRDDDVAAAVRTMTQALRYIARRYDCDYIDHPKDRPSPCDCPPCTAKGALERHTTWRYRGAHAHRLSGHAREAAIVAAWAALIDDKQLAQILGAEDADASEVTPRDWLVATTVVQWLATNVGQTVLSGAGYVYSRDEFDRAVRDTKGGIE